MTLRHPAALALVGWYFMLPPLKANDPDGFDSDVRLARWQVVASYDTKEASENIADKMVGVTRRDSLRLAVGSCLAADDPRLNSK